MPFETKSYVELNLRLQTAAGAVNVPGRRICYIVDEGDEFLASHETLKSIGLDIDRWLEKVAKQQREADGDDLGAESDAGPMGSQKSTSREDSDDAATRMSGPTNRDVGTRVSRSRKNRRVKSRVYSTQLSLPTAKDELQEALQGMVAGAVKNGFPQQHAVKLWNVLVEFDIWRLKFNESDPPAKVKPLRVTPKEGCVPYRCKGRKNNPLEERFLTLFAQELVDAGVIKRNQQSAWCSPVNPVMKPDGRKSLKTADKWTNEDVLKHFRLTNDYRVVNSKTEPKAGTMPFQATITQHLKGMRAMGVFDLPNGDGVRQDPARIEQLCAIPYPTNAGDLQQFICAVNWIRESITEYAMTVEPLQQALNMALEGKAKKKRIASGIKIELTQEEKAAFDAVKSKTRTAVDLSHPRADATLCLFTDASDQGWSIIVTQVDKFDDELPIQEQSHEMLVCQSGMFTGAQKSWSVIEKEAYPIARACEKLNYLLMRPEGFRMYCDHKNLIHIFAPGKEWPEHTRGKLMRWAAIIGGYRYTIEHIDGIHNLWADMMSRWGRPATGMATHKVLAARWTKKRKQPRHTLKRNTLRPLDEENFIWPCINDILKTQAAHVNARPKEAKRTSDDQPWIVDERLWIPAAAEDLIQRTMVVAHC
ncbi:hypothetical protein AeMF1_009017 [Aphanomyces euteiches]|nr:hypothetical protein AeMF1_009017 [Aphanomyces euteiches]